MILIVDYGMGNLKSVENAFAKVGHRTVVSEDPRSVRKADAIVLPGVGAFRDAIKIIKEKQLDKELVKAIRLGKPFLGICLGMQLLLSYSEEGGKFEGLNVFEGSANKFSGLLKCPHMGWNNIKYKVHSGHRKNPIFKNISDGSYFYFVHSYYCEIADPEVIASTTDYGLSFSSSVWQNNLFGVQFHPEKSSALGLELLKNFGDLVK